MIANPDEFQAIFLGTADKNISIDLGLTKIVGSPSQSKGIRNFYCSLV